MSLYFRMLQQQRRCMEYFLSIYFLSLLLNLLWRLEDTESLSHKCALQKGQHTPAKFVIIISATFLGGGAHTFGNLKTDLLLAKWCFYFPFVYHDEWESVVGRFF